MQTRVWIPLLVLLGNVACVTVHFTPLQPFDRPPRPVGSVEFFRAGMPNRPYREVGILRVNSSIGFDAAMQKLLEAGANYGCDAVAGIREGEYANVAVGYYGIYAQQHDTITASCLLWDAAEGAPQPGFAPPTQPAPMQPPPPMAAPAPPGRDD